MLTYAKAAISLFVMVDAVVFLINICRGYVKTVYLERGNPKIKIIDNSAIANFNFACAKNDWL